MTRIPSTHDGAALAPFPVTARVGPRGLEIGGCALVDVARAFGTPAYVLCEETLRVRARAYLSAFAGRDRATQVLFASKAFPSRPVFEILRDEGLGFDVASGGELFLALEAGADPATMVLHGNAKGTDELEAAVRAGVGHVVLDNEDDVDRLERLGVVGQPVLLRITPGIDVETHPSIATGHAASKFGVPLERAAAVIARCEASPALDLRGLHVHVGSQLRDLAAFESSIAALAGLGSYPVYDVGGGLGVPHTAGEEVPSIAAYADAIHGAADRWLPADATLMVEPGRSIAAPAGVSLYEVVTVKRGRHTHVAVNGGMSDSLGVALHDHPRAPCIVTRPGGDEVCQLVGKHCESGDVLARDVRLDDPRPGDLLALPVAGAYTFTLANNYNAVLRSPVVVCAGGDARLAVRREELADLVARDVIA